MKLLRFETADKVAHFGAVVGDNVASFAQMADYVGVDPSTLQDLGSIDGYLQALPASEAAGKKLVEAAVQKGGDCGVPLGDVNILIPLPNLTGFIDFGFSPRHIILSGPATMRREFNPIVAKIIRRLLRKRAMGSYSTTRPPYYFSNHMSAIGTGGEMSWPPYAHYLDIEAELGIVTGTAEQPVAGYIIVNDGSVRDIQFPEIRSATYMRSKNFDGGLGLGPFIVTADEVGDFQNLAVDVKIGDRYHWKGHTSDYIGGADEALGSIKHYMTLPPGVVLGFGTVPGCCGQDNDQWIEPGDTIEITIEKLGTLVQHTPANPKVTEPGRWEARDCITVTPEG